MTAWPKAKSFSARYRVEDLVPSRAKLKAVFIGESPHRDEVASDDPEKRSPFRGVAGREWWSELSKLLDEPLSVRPMPERDVLLAACEELGIALMNAVQFPIDPKITLHQGEASTPRDQLGFEKGTGEFGYKAVHKVSGERGPAGAAIRDLAARLAKLEKSGAQLVCLGNDSRWFVEKALECLRESGGPNRPFLEQALLTIPHPSSWWRNAEYKRRAVETVRSLLGDGLSAGATAGGPQPSGSARKAQRSRGTRTQA